MTPPMHHDDYLSTHLDDHHTEEAAPAHHLPFDRTSPADPTQDTTEQDDDEGDAQASHHEPHDAVAAESDEVSDDFWTAEATEHVHVEHAHSEHTHADHEHADHTHTEHAYAGHVHDDAADSDAGSAAAEADATGAVDSHEGSGSAEAHQPVAVASAHAPVQSAAKPADNIVSSAADARGLLEGIALNLRALAGREGADGAPVAIFPRGVDLLEVRMHISRDRDIDLNFRVAGPTTSNPSV